MAGVCLAVPSSSRQAMSSWMGIHVHMASQYHLSRTSLDSPSKMVYVAPWTYSETSLLRTKLSRLAVREEVKGVQIRIWFIEDAWWPQQGSGEETLEAVPS